jgi:hypothetical protein
MSDQSSGSGKPQSSQAPAVRPQAVIYKPAKTSMQSGGGGSAKAWVLEFYPETAQTPDPLTGWVGGAETRTQVKVKFSDRESAEAYAKQRHIAYEVRETAPRKRVIKSYSDNFAPHRKESWTH